MQVEKLGTKVDVNDVVRNGGAILHGLSPSGSVGWVGGGAPAAAATAPQSGGAGAAQQPTAAAPAAVTPRRDVMAVRSLDAALVAPGNNTDIWNWDAYTAPNSTQGGLGGGATGANARDGAAFCLFNNLWSTNVRTVVLISCPQSMHITANAPHRLLPVQ